MDIKPFVYEGNFWADSAVGWIAAFGFVALSIVGMIWNKKDKSSGGAVALIAAGFIGVLVSSMIAPCLPAKAEKEAYNRYVSETQVTTLEANSFYIVSGNLDLKPNTQSSLLLRYQNKNFDCTLFSPKDVEENVVFSCGEAKLSLEEVQKTVDGK